jgi:hypothetical protein
MAKSRPTRSMAQVGESQQVVEESHSKFLEAKPAQETRKPQSVTGRNFPLVGFTIAPEDKEIMDSLALYLSNKKGKIITKSALQRALIRLGNKHKEELEVE